MKVFYYQLKKSLTNLVLNFQMKPRIRIHIALIILLSIVMTFCLASKIYTKHFTTEDSRGFHENYADITLSKDVVSGPDGMAGADGSVTGNRYILSLTTIPSKFDKVHVVIDSLLKQTLKPSKIVINIPKVYNFRFDSKSIPRKDIDKLRERYSENDIMINIMDKDYGPVSKLMGLFNNFDKLNLREEEKEKTFIVLVDDDHMYKPYMLKYFDDNLKRNKGIEVASYWIIDYKHVTIGQGADGFFMKYNTLSKFRDYYNIIKDLDYVHYHDDFLISYYFLLRKQKVHYIKAPNNRPVYDIFNQIDGLKELNGKYSRDNLNEKISEIFENIGRDKFRSIM